MSHLISRLERLFNARQLVLGDALEPFSRDESDFGKRVPDAGVYVESAEEVEALVFLARELGVPLVARGAGTGKVGGALAERGGIVVSFERMNAIREIDHNDGVARVEPGVLTKTLQDAVEAQGLFYPPDPSSLATSTLGGNVAHDAGGPRALKYGVTRNWVLGLHAVLGTGERVRTGHRSIKGVAGYDLTALLVGSEGTLGLVTEIMLRLIPKPEAVETALAVFAGAEGETQALRAVGALFARGVLPRACEFLDTSAIRALAGRASFPLPANASSALVVEVDGTPEGCEAELGRVYEACRGAGAHEVVLARHAEERRHIWETRRAVSPALRAIRPLKVSEDVAVPRGRILDMVRAVRDIGARYGLETACYGHAGDGNLHVNLLFESRDDEVRVAQAIGEVMRKAVELGGTITGEHGVGLSKRAFLSLEQSSPLIEAQRRIKRALDPDDILNPGKVFPPPVLLV